MAVNGIEIAVGQKWKTRGGGVVTIAPTRPIDDDSENYPFTTTTGYTLSHNGGFWHDRKHEIDLIELVEDPDAGDFTGVSAKSGLDPADRRVEQSALAIQVGGTHYKDFAIQPVEYIHANKLGFCEGNVVKYITRHAAKNGADDIRKVIHYCQLLLELQYGVKKEGVSK